MQTGNIIILVSATLSLMTMSSCSSNKIHPENSERQVLDNGVNSDIPTWVSDNKIRWNAEGNIHKFKAFHSIKGDERLTACYELSKLNAQEAITTEIWSEFKAAISHSTQSISESSEDIFMQSRNLASQGKIRGLRFTEAFHQRYLVNGVERLDCFVLGELADGDYQQMRAHLLRPVVQANPELKKAIEENHMELFRKNEPAKKEPREPGSTLPEKVKVITPIQTVIAKDLELEE